MIDVSFACKPDGTVLLRLRQSGYEVKDYGVVDGYWTIRISPAKPTQSDVGRICQVSGVHPLTHVTWREVT